MPAHAPAGVPGFLVGGVGELEREEGALFQDEEVGPGLAADEKRGEGGEVGLVADDGDIAAVLRMEMEAFGEFAGIVLWLDAGNLDAKGVDEKQPGGELVGGLSGADERAVPDLGGAKHAAGPQKAGEAGYFAAASRAERSRAILVLREGVGVAHEVKEHTSGGRGARSRERGARSEERGAGSWWRGPGVLAGSKPLAPRS